MVKDPLDEDLNCIQVVIWMRKRTSDRLRWQGANWPTVRLLCPSPWFGPELKWCRPYDLHSLLMPINNIHTSHILSTSQIYCELCITPVLSNRRQGWLQSFPWYDKEDRQNVIWEQPESLVPGIQGKLRELLKFVESRAENGDKRQQVLNAYAEWLSDREKKVVLTHSTELLVLMEYMSQGLILRIESDAPSQS